MKRVLLFLSLLIASFAKAQSPESNAQLQAAIITGLNLTQYQLEEKNCAFNFLFNVKNDSINIIDILKSENCKGHRLVSEITRIKIPKDLKIDENAEYSLRIILTYNTYDPILENKLKRNVRQRWSAKGVVVLDDLKINLLNVSLNQRK